MNVEPTGTPPGVRALPANVVTFLLSDIVGSTRLWDESAAAMARSLLRHDELVAAAVARHGGVLLKSKGEGDSTFSVFTRATDGADAALAVQQAIAAETWPPDTPIVVRMSLYTGEVVERGGDYYGTVVNRAARLRSLAGPGEVLVGQSTADLLADHLAPPAVLTELGLRQLKDLNRPELVYSLRSFVPALSPTQNASEDDYYGRPEDPTRSTATNGQLVIALPSHVERPETSGFFGRAEEFDTITAAMAAVRREGWRQSVLLGGEPGIGKTRLALEAARRIHADGDVTVLCGRAMEGGSQPFHAFAEALTHLVRELPVGLLVEHVRIHGGELALVVPEVRSRVPQTPPARGHDQESDRYLVFGAIAALIESVTKSQPLMLVLDDLQWADTSSLQLLRHLTQAADIRNLLLLVTFRNTDVDPSSAFGRVLADLWRERGVRRMDLAGLGLEDLLALMSARAGQKVDPTDTVLAETLLRETGGNPFLLGELFLHLAETGAIRRSAAGGWELTTDLDHLSLPRSIHDIVRSRVTRAGAEAAHALEAAAVIGFEFELSVLCAVLAHEADALIDTLDHCERSSLIGANPETGTYSFTHALIRRSLLEELTTSRRRELHRRVATVLERDPTMPAAEIARQWIDVGADSRDIALTWAMRAGGEALQQLAPGDAAHWYAVALGLHDAASVARRARGDEHERARRRVELLVDLGDAQRQSGDARYRQTLLDAAAAAQGLDNAELLVRAVLANNRGLESVTGAVDEERVRFLEAALDVAGAHDSRNRAALLATLAAELSFDPDTARRTALADEALALARRLGDEHVLLHVFGRRFYTILSPDRIAQCLDDTAEYLALAARLDDPVALVFAGVYRAEVMLMAADIEGYDHALAVAEAALERTAQPFLRYLVLIKQSQRATLAGAIEKAEVLATEALKVGRAIGLNEAVANYTAQVARVRHLQGRLDEIIEVFERLTANPASHASLKPILGVYYCRADRHDDARRMFDAAGIIEFAGRPRDRYTLAALAVYAEVCVYLGEAAVGAVLYDLLRPYHDQIMFSGSTFIGSTGLHCARLATMLGRLDEAEVFFAEAQQVHRRLGAVMLSVQSDCDWAEMLSRRGGEANLARARELVEPQHALAVSHGWAPLVDRAAQLLASLPAAAARPRRSN